jgi:hypothetical protein
MRGPQVAEVLSNTLGKPIKYDPCTPAEFGRFLADAGGDDVPAETRDELAAGIGAFYEYNNTAPTRPFAVDMDHVYDRFPELEGKLEPMSEWAPKQNWGESNKRPAFG